ncbi:LAO/AO transport system ATPase domain protein [Mycobacterium xenopi 3993]|nr:LAO/AO transport system ATPase domain protein [Mycobacterium xenopi 3993]
MNVAELIAAARNGSPRAAGRLLSLIESDRRNEVLASLGPSSVRVIGVTGPPGRASPRRSPRSSGPIGSSGCA